MWPSMSRKDFTSAPASASDSRTAKRKSQIPMLFDVLPSEEEGLASLMTAEMLGHGEGFEGFAGIPSRDMRMKREMAELERWLIDNEDLHEREEQFSEAEHSQDGETRPDARFSLKFEDDEDVDPWTRTDLLGTRSGSGRGTGTGGGTTPSTEIPPTRSPPAVDGFEDDFTAFISAPSPFPSLSQPQTHSQTNTHLNTSEGEGAHLQIPTHTGTSFRSGASQASSSFSDFGVEDDFFGLGQGHGYQALSDDHDHDHFHDHFHEQEHDGEHGHGDGDEHEDDGGGEEDHEQARKGHSRKMSDFDPTSDMHGDNSAFNPWTTESFTTEPSSSSSFPATTSSSFPAPSSRPPRHFDQFDLGAGPGPSLDLADILSTLQTVREDVAGMEDEDVRRMVGARVAAGFVLRRMGVGESEDGEGDGDTGVDERNETGNGEGGVDRKDGDEDEGTSGEGKEKDATEKAQG